MGLNNLTDDEKKVVFDSLNAAVHGPFFPGGLFQTLLGFDRAEILDIISKWATIDEQDKQVEQAINGVLLQLNFYPHGLREDIYKYIHCSLERLETLFFKFKGIEPWPEEKWDGVVKGFLTKRARAVWNRFDSEKRQRIISSAWCPYCEKRTTITNYEGGIDKDNRLSIYGKCVECFKTAEINAAIE